MVNIHPSLTPFTFFFYPPQPCSSQSWGRHGFHRAHDPAHLSHTENWGGAYPVHYGDVGLLLVGSLASPPCPTGLDTARAATTARGARLSHTCSWLRPGLETEIGGANARAFGSCHVTDEALAMILTQVHATCLKADATVEKKKNYVFCIQIHRKKILWKIYVVANICLEFTQYGFFRDNQPSPFKLECAQHYFLLILC